jgi:hypothetical protein
MNPEKYDVESSSAQRRTVSPSGSHREVFLVSHGTSETDDRCDVGSHGLRELIGLEAAGDQPSHFSLHSRSPLSCALSSISSSAMSPISVLSAQEGMSKQLYISGRVRDRSGFMDRGSHGTY